MQSWSMLQGRKTTMWRETRACGKKVQKVQCLADTGKQPIGTNLVDTNKGDDVSPKVRSRIVALELKRSAEFEFFLSQRHHPSIIPSSSCHVPPVGKPRALRAAS